MPHPSPRFSTEGGLEIEKTDSTTVKTIAEPYFLASVNFYRTAIKNNIETQCLKRRRGNPAPLFHVDGREDAVVPSVAY